MSYAQQFSAVAAKGAFQGSDVQLQENDVLDKFSHGEATMDDLLHSELSDDELLTFLPKDIVRLIRPGSDVAVRTQTMQAQVDDLQDEKIKREESKREQEQSLERAQTLRDAEMARSEDDFFKNPDRFEDEFRQRGYSKEDWRRSKELVGTYLRDRKAEREDAQRHGGKIDPVLHARLMASDQAVKDDPKAAELLKRVIERNKHALRSDAEVRVSPRDAFEAVASPESHRSTQPSNRHEPVQDVKIDQASNPVILSTSDKLSQLSNPSKGPVLTNNQVSVQIEKEKADRGKNSAALLIEERTSKLSLQSENSMSPGIRSSALDIDLSGYNYFSAKNMKSDFTAVTDRPLEQSANTSKLTPLQPVIRSKVAMDF